jgi:quercetin dioxygenase-like cupin family protein
MMETETLNTSRSIFQNVLNQFLSRSSRDDEVLREVAKERAKIKKLATRVSFSYKSHTERVDFGDEWLKLADGVHSIACSLNSDDCTVINVIFEEGGHILPHYHDRDEYLFVASGKIVETVSGRTINEGESIKIPGATDQDKTWHGWKSDGAKLTVVWKPPFPYINE